MQAAGLEQRLLWKYMRRKVTHNHLFESMGTLVEAVEAFFARLDSHPAEVLSVIGCSECLSWIHLVDIADQGIAADDHGGGGAEEGQPAGAQQAVGIGDGGGAEESVGVGGLAVGRKAVLCARGKQTTGASTGRG